MAIDRVYPDELDPPITDDDELPPITADDVAHTVERLTAGRESGLYEHMRTSDLYVIGHLSRLGEETYKAALCDPAQLPRFLAPVITKR